jgi:pimeloyl-ACP methyl ester carboxylesterase
VNAQEVGKDPTRAPDAHGVEVFSRWWTIDEPRGVVLIAHGASEHSGRYDRFAHALNSARFSAVALDHRGHGRTATSSGPGVMGCGNGDAVIDDLHELRTAAASTLESDAPVFLFGHSMSSLIALAYLARHAASIRCPVFVIAGDHDPEAVGEAVGVGRSQPAYWWSHDRRVQQAGPDVAAFLVKVLFLTATALTTKRQVFERALRQQPRAGRLLPNGETGI